MLRTLFRPGIDLPEQQVEANRRYWESEESVNGIAEAMGISKGRLYELLLPFDADRPCPECGAPLGFAHRTARQRGDVSCGACGFEGNLGDLPELDAEALAALAALREGAGASSEGGTGSEEGEGDGRGSAPLLWHDGAATAAPPLDRSTLVGVALLGTAAGLLLARLLRR